MRQAPGRQGRRQSPRAKVRLAGLMRRPRGALLVATALQATTLLVLTVPAFAQPAPNAQPQGGKVAAGSAVISQTSTLTTITQSSQNAAINWSSFNVGSNQTVDFAQPSSTASTLNRVNSPDPSQIAGRINANGTVVLVNQNGVVFDQGAQVNVGGLMVSAVGISTKNYMAGKMVFNRPGNPNAAVVNNGNITVKQAGLAALVAPQVVNAGVINARMGHVVLAGAKTATLDLYGDGLVSIDVTSQMTKAPLGPNDQQVAALVTNTGTIRADGGTVQLTARAVDGLVQNLVTAGGTIAANSVGSHTGKVLISGVGGSVMVTGTVTAEGYAPGTTGGAIGVNATDGVALTSTARLNASGQAGGGLVAVGTTLKRAAGGPSVTGQKTAKTVTVARGATIAANAIAKGNGGRVTVLSGETTVMNGAILAVGGGHGGNGGFVEISGGTLGMATGSVNVAAPLGSPGAILLDPLNLNITASTGNLDGSFTGTVTAGQDSGDTDTLSASVLTGFSGNVTLQATNTIDVQSSFSLGAGALTLQAGNGIQIDTGVSVGASGNILLALNGAGAGTPASSGGTPLITVGGTLASSVGSVSLLSGTGGQVSISASGAVQATSGNTITLQTDTLTNAGTIIANSGTVEIAPATSGNTIDFAGSGAGTLLVSTNSLAGISTGTLRLGAATIGGTPTITAGAITFDTSVSLTGIASTLDLQSTGAVTETTLGALDNVATLTGTTGAVSLAQLANTGPTTIGTYTVTGSGDFDATVTGSTSVSGTLTANNVNLQTIGASSIAVNGTVAATGTVALGSGSIALGGTSNVQGTTITLSGAVGVGMSGTAVLGKAGQTVLLDVSTTLGAFTEPATATINAGTVQSSNGIGGTVSLLGTANSIGSIGAFAITNGDFDLVSTGSLNVAGPLTGATNVSFAAGTIGIGGTIVAAGTLALAAGSGGIALNTGEVLSGAIVDLSASGGGVTQISTGTINAGTLQSSLGITGTVTLAGANTIGSLGSVDVTNGDFSLVNLGILAVSGPLAADDILLSSSTIGVTGSIGATTDLALVAGTGGIVLNTGQVLSGATVDLSATGGGITQVATGTIIAGIILQSGSGVTGTVDLAGTANTIVALGSFAVASGDFTLVSTGRLSVPGIVGAGNISLNAGTIAIGGTLGAATLVALGASAGGIAETGAISAATLASNGTIAGGATLTGSNTIASLGTLAVSGGDLSVADTGSLSVAGLVSAPNIALTAGTIGIPGSLSAGTLLSLGASAGGILQATTSVIDAPTVSSIGTITGGVTLAGTENQIGAFGSFGFTGAFMLNDSVAVSFDRVFGGASATRASIDGASATIASTGSLDIGTLAVTTTVGGIALAGSVTATSSVDLSAAGTIDQTGGIITTGTLTGSSVGGASLTQGNAVGTFGGFTNTTNGTLSFTNASSLITAGTISSAGDIVLTTTGSGSNLTLDGNISTPGNNLTLAAAGSIGQSNGVVTAGTLNTSSAGGVTLGDTNQVSSLGPVTNSGTGGVTLVDGTALTVGGTVNAGTQALALTASGSLAVNAALTAGTDVLLQGASIGLGANVTDGTTGTLALVSAGAITQSAGSIAVGTLTATTSAAGDVTLASATNQINVSSGISLNNGNLVLVDDLSLVLTGAHSANNLFYEVNATGGTLQIGSNSAGATLTAGSAQRISLVADTITAGDVSSTLTAPGGVVELAPYSSGATVSLAGNAGNLIAGPVFSDINTGTIVVGRYTDLPNGGTLNVSAGSISVDGSVGLAGHATSLGLFAQGAISQSTGTLIVDTLFGSGTSVSLLAQGNQIGTLGTFVASDGNVLLEDRNTLTVAGLVSATGSVYLQSANGSGISVSGTVAAGSSNLVSFQAAKLTNSGTVTGGTFEFATNAGGILNLGTSAGLASLAGIGATAIRIGAVTLPNDTSPTTTAGSLLIEGSFGASGITLELDSLGGIRQTAGSLSAGTLTGTAGTSVNLRQAGNLIGTLAAFTSGDGFALTDDEALQVNGPVQDTGAASTVALTTRTGGIILAGDVTAANAIDLISAGGVSQSGGLISAATLSGSAGGGVALDAANQIALLDGFSVTGGGFSLVDSSNLTISLLLSASNIAVNIGSNQLTLAGASIATNGDTRSSGTTFAPSLAPSGGAPGALFEAGNFTQTGASSVTTLTGTHSTLQILSSHNITFSDLVANGTWLILQLPGNGHASGSIAVSALDLNYTSVNGGGSANLSGSIAGITGSAAAGLANILPEPSPFYQFNSCPIHSINCVVLPTLNLPVIPQIATLFFGPPELPSDDPNLIFIMPNVAKQDY